MIDRNAIGGCEQNAIRLVGAIGVEGLRTADNRLRAEISRNRLAAGGPTVVVQAAARVAGSRPWGNVVEVRLLENVLDGPTEGAVVVSEGMEGNRVEVEAGGQEVDRTDEDLIG